MEYYLISPDIICHYYGGYEVASIRECLADFLMSERKTKDTSELYFDFLSRQSSADKLKERIPDLHRWLNEDFVTGPCCKEMVNQLFHIPDLLHDGPFNLALYHFYPSNPAPGFNQQTGVILNQRVPVSYEKYPVIFRKVFAFMFNRSESPKDLFQHHFETTFCSNVSEFKDFLFHVEKENMEIIGDGIKLWNHLAESVNVVTRTFTHREYELADEFKVEAGLELRKSAKELKDISRKRYDARRSLTRSKDSKAYRPPTRQELENVLKLLKEFPSAHRIAQEALSKTLV